MDIFDLARQHYTAVRAESLGTVDVPEWADAEGNIPVIYVRSMNLSEDSERTKYALEKNLKDFNVFTLIFCACDENFKPIFKRSDASYISNQMSAAVIARVVAEINKILEREQQGEIDQEKKS